MKNGYQALIWVRDDNDGIYACFADDIEESQLDNLLFFNPEEQSRCLDLKSVVENRHR
jgi:hypothetical protein